MTPELAVAVGAAVGAPVAAASAVGGGDVAEAYRVRLGDGRTVFAKSHRRPPPGFFTTEADGLRWLRDAAALGVPEVLAVDDGPPAFLVLAWIDHDGRRVADERAFGRALARLHRAGAPCFGREDRRTTGSRRLPNEPCPTWADFYASQRLLPLARLAREERALRPAVADELERLAGRLASFGGAEPPARLHGDLWAGNRLVDRDGRSWLIDPAAHGGHREFDLAMMRLFGGFGAEAYGAYAEEWPLPDGWEARIPLHQLAPLAVHAIKFGGSYVAGVERALAALR